MELALKPDWPAACERIHAWWEHELIDRVCLAVTAPKAGATPRAVPAPATLAERWTNWDYRLDQHLAWLESTWYGGEAFPVLMPNLGPDVFASWLGAELRFMPETSWVEPIVDDWADSLDDLRLDESSWSWQWMLEATRTACASGEGRFMVGLTDLHPGMDLLAALRHPDRLCLDLMLCPDLVEAAMQRVMPLYYQAYQTFHELIQRTHTGSTTWLTAYSSGKYYPTSCDFAALIGPAHFDRFVRPDIEAQCAWLDHALFHLDGPQCLQHVPSLCSIPGLRAIQWVHGAGHAPMTRWIDLLGELQQRGMGLHLSVLAEEVEPLLEALDPRGLFLHTGCRTQEQGEELLRQAAKWTSAALRRVGA